MNTRTATKLIEDTFNAAFDESQFTQFIQNLLNDVEPKNNRYGGISLWEDYREHINSYKRIGKYIDPDGEALDVLIVEVKTITKLQRARTALRNFVIKHLSKFDKDYALVAFYSKEDNGMDWRFSFIKLEYSSVWDKEKQKVKTQKEFTPAKRYSFLVGKYEKAYTAKNQLLPLLQNLANNPTIDELENAFSIERVTDEFFEQYKDLYTKLYEHFEKDRHIKTQLQQANIQNARFTKKLLGQIVFLYFLQKKGWLGVPIGENWGKGDKRFVQSLFDKAEANNENFFKDYLQYLFYEALAKQRDNINSNYEHFNCRIPFLNGGLFEAEYDWENANIEIPTSLFRNKEKNKAGDIGTGVLDVFDRYNFTIKEDEPLDKEVAVDPEMLGKVFENMLEITERKSKGAFYTPREIVHYMCQESLIHYLDNALNNHQDNIIPKADIEQYIREGHISLENDWRTAQKGETKTYQYQLPESIRKVADLIDKKLTEIRICDPAIGSGAFPVGLLHELVTAQLVIKPHLSADYQAEKNKHFGFRADETVSESRYVYRLKRQIIQESIYGVDIDASAIDIARLRLWLSLVVDEDSLDPIETLPNLDYKIVCGDSLIGLPAMRSYDIEEEIEKLKTRFYHETNEGDKKRLREQINDKIQMLLDSSLSVASKKITFDFKLFFSEVWREKNGFDIVIGNPPYGAKLTKEEKKYFKVEYNNVHMRTPDTFNYFISKGLRLIRDKGVLSYIVPNNLLFQSEYEKTRKLLLRQNQFRIGINLGDGVFNTATVPSCIFLVTKKNENINPYLYADIRNINKKNISLKSIFNTESITSTLETPASVFGIPEKEFKIIKKLKNISIKIDDIADEMASGISTGGDKIFRVSKDLAEELNLEEELLKPVLVGGEIDKYKIKNTEHYVIYTDRKLDIENYPNIEYYLSDFDEKLSRRSEARSGVMPWFSLNRQRYPGLFEGEKLIMRQTADRIRATYDNNSFYVIDSILVFRKKAGIRSSYKYILSILNSSVNTFLYRKFTQEGGRTFAQVKPKNVRKLYIPKTSKHNQDIATQVVDYLLSYHRISQGNHLLVTFFESLIDTIAFELFLPESVKTANKEVLKHLGDLKPLEEAMSDEEKMAIIQSEFERLYDPNHAVRYAIETIDSIEEVRIIKEALK